MRTVRGWWRLWFTFEHNVDRRAYLVSGIVLAGVKFAGDLLMVWSATGEIWSPRAYIAPLHTLATTRLSDAPGWLLPLLAMWTLPFLWVGINMSMRRVLDTGMSAWLALLFFVPGLSYLFMALMCALPSSAPRMRPLHEPRAYETKLPGALLSIGAGAAVGLFMLAVSVLGFASYGVSLFLGAPFVIGAVTAFLFNRRYPASTRETLQVTSMAIACVAGVALLTAQEGALCLVMAAPLGIGIGAMGAVFGRQVARLDGGSSVNAMIAVVLLPISATLDRGRPTTALREVRSSIEIDASTDRVWRSVIAFPPLPKPAELVFRSGIAYPIRAEIRGSGVGAVRYCVFSTGAFVEPITRWEPGVRLGFDVDSQPPPLVERSLYAGIAPPHLDGYFRSRRGEFRLIALADGRTRLEGSTWYEIKLHPEAYWVLFGDALIARIHQRVLHHIRAVAEAEGARPTSRTATTN